MSIISLDGELDFTPYNRTSSVVHLSHKSKRGEIHLGPKSFSDKWKIPSSGFYTPTDVRLVITPHISEKAGVMAVVKLIDASDMSPARVLYQSKEFNLGHGLTLEGTQLPFCLPIGEYPILFEVTVSRSQFVEARTMFTTSLEWRMMWSSTPLSRVKSVFAVAHQPVIEVSPTFKNIVPLLDSGPRAGGKSRKSRTSASTSGGTVQGLVTLECVGPVGAVSNSN